MVIIPNYTLSEPARPTVRGPERNSAQSLRPTFTGWGPQDLRMSRASIVGMLIAAEIVDRRHRTLRAAQRRALHAVHEVDFGGKPIAPIGRWKRAAHRGRRSPIADRRRDLNRRLACTSRIETSIARRDLRRSGRRAAARSEANRRRRFDFATGVGRARRTLRLRLVRAAHRNRRSGRIAPGYRRAAPAPTCRVSKAASPFTRRTVTSRWPICSGTVEGRSDSGSISATAFAAIRSRCNRPTGAYRFRKLRSAH